MPSKKWIAAGLVMAIPALYLLLPVIAPLPEVYKERIIPTSLVVVDREGGLLHEFLSESDERLHWVGWDRISPHLEQVFVFKEDSRFNSHPGVDPVAVCRAIYQNVRSGRIVSGGSTITQQLARYLLGSRPRTISSKIREALLALRLERELPKKEILLRYLNLAPFGNQVRGVERASQFYLRKPASRLSLMEAAYLSVIPRSPIRLDPRRNPGAVRDEALKVLDRMREDDLITGEELLMARAEDLSPRERFTPFRAPHLVQYLRSKEWGCEPSWIRTTIDYELQKQTETALEAELASLSDMDVSNGAVVVLENSTGKVLAFVGSLDFTSLENEGQNNGCLAPRQPGSALKPFTYSLAVEKGMTLADIVPDVEAHFPTSNGDYSPRNYNNRFYGPVRVREALANSLNVSAIKVTEKLGVPSVLHRLRNLGLDTLDKGPEHYGLGITLGNGDVRLLQLTAAYAAIARGGVTVSPRFIEEIRDPSGRDHEYIEMMRSYQVIEKEAAYLVADVLSDENARMGTFGVLSPLNFPFRVAVKTGTSTSFTDNWTIGFTREVTVGVWVGNFNATPMKGISGVTGAGPVFHRVMMAAMEDRDRSWYEKPEGITDVKVCSLSGALPGRACEGTMEEYFIEGTQPVSRCSYHRNVELDVRNGLLAHSNTPPEFRIERIFTIFPPPYTEWARSEMVPVPPVSYSPLDDIRVVHEARKLEIVYPDDDQVYILDPFTPHHYQTVLPVLDIDEPLARVEWLLDGTVVSKGAAMDPASIPLTLGQHSLKVRDPGSGAVSRTVRLKVVPPEEMGYFW